MKTITLKARSDHAGIVKLEIPTNLADREVEIVLVLHAHDAEPVDAMGYPLGYFEETYGSFAEEPLMRNQPLYPDVRDALE
jgi:hypothetical protein